VVDLVMAFITQENTIFKAIIATVGLVYYVVELVSVLYPTCAVYATMLITLIYSCIKGRKFSAL
jgi:hypothetical protein